MGKKRGMTTLGAHWRSVNNGFLDGLLGKKKEECVIKSFERARTPGLKTTQRISSEEDPSNQGGVTARWVPPQFKNLWGDPKNSQRSRSRSEGG